MPYFDHSLYCFNEPQPSLWEADTKPINRPDGNPLDDTQSCDVAIIGGGYTGLSAAYHLAKDYNVDVRVIEAGHIGWGSSGRNGGFCCMGGTMLGVSQLIRKFGVDEARKYYQAQAEAVELVRTIAADEEIDFDEMGKSEMVVAEKPGHFEELIRECDIQRDVLGIDCRMISREEFREQCYDAPHQHGALVQSPGFGLHPLKYCLGLANAAARHGAKLHDRSKVINWEKSGKQHHLETGCGGSLKANHVMVACNGFMPENLKQGLSGRILPLQSQIIVTRPLSEGELAAHAWKTNDPAINSRNVYFYYRKLPDNRILIGGRADFTGRLKSAEETAEKLHQAFGKLWPEWRGIEYEYMWRGFVCFTSRLRPSIGRLPDDPSIYLGYGYHGNGVNNATWAGRELAKWLVEGNDKMAAIPDHLPAIVQGVSSKFPLPKLRRQYARAGVAWHRFKDMVD